MAFLPYKTDFQNDIIGQAALAYVMQFITDQAAQYAAQQAT